MVRAYDGRYKETVLTELVNCQLNIRSINELIGFVYDKSTNKRDIAKLAPKLAIACSEGDAAALDIAGIIMTYSYFRTVRGIYLLFN